MGKKQSRSNLLKGIVAACLLLNHFGGYAPIINASINNSLNQSVQSEVQENELDSVLDNNQIVTSSNEESLIVEEAELENVQNNERITNNSEKEQSEQITLEEQQGPSNLEVEEPILEDSILLAQEDEENSTRSESRSIGSGLVQLWQVVPDGQNQEGKTTSQIMSALQCRPNHNLYPLNGQSQHQTYINSCYVDDALYLGEDETYYYIYLSGYEGKVPKSETHTFSLDLNRDGEYVDYQIQTVAYYIPGSNVKTISNDEVIHPDASELNYYDQHLNKYSEADAKSIDFYSTATVQSPSYYANDNGTLVHYVTNNVKVANNYSKVTVGKAPSWMSSGVKYYSYDGIYFYTNWQNIRVNGQGAVNQNNPFYNYYQYLPFRSKTNHSSNAIDSYTNNNGGTGGKLVDTGQYFYAVQDKYGINGALQYAMGIHESGWGKSSLSLDKNNLFGMNATDNNPYGNGTSFPTVEAGINYHADRYLSWGYTDPLDDWRYFGAHVGNKGSGMNVKYASDPFWGEKIAGWYYRFDNTNGLKDYNYYTIGIKQSNAVLDVKSAASETSKTLYQTRNKRSNLNISNYPVLITGQQGGYYKIKSDTPIVNQKPVFNAQYKWNDTNVYIKKSNIYLSNALTNHSPSPDNSNVEYIGRLDNIQWNGNILKVEGYGELSGYPTPTANSVKHIIVLVNNSTKKEYSFNLTPTYNSWLANDPHKLGGNYAYSWYSGSLDLNNLPNGSYKLYHEVTVNGHTQREELKFYNDLASKIVNLKQYSFGKYNGSSLMMTKEDVTELEYIGRLDSVIWSGEKLAISGYGELAGLSMSNASQIKHQIVFENSKDSSKKYTYTMTPTYNNWLANDPHNLGGNYAYAWYEGTIDLSTLPNGTYKIYHEVTVNGYKQREELKFYNDLASKIVKVKQYSFSKYNGSSLTMTKEDSLTREYVGRLDSAIWSGEKLAISGYGELAGLSMSNASQIKHQIVFENSKDSSKKYTYTMTPTYNNWLANDPHNLGGNYAYAWYEGTIDLSTLPNGTYKIYHEVTVNGYKQREELKFYNDLASRIVKVKQYSFSKYNGSSLMMTKEDSLTREYIGRLDSMTWNNGKLKVSGYGELAGLSMSSASDVKHELIIENWSSSWKQYSYTLTPKYSSWLANDPHNLGGNYTYGWYEGTIDLSNLPWGTYRVYHQMTVNGYTQREELKFYDNIPTKTVNGYSYEFLKYNSNSVKLSKQIEK